MQALVLLADRPAQLSSFLFAVLHGKALMLFGLLLLHFYEVGRQRGTD